MRLGQQAQYSIQQDIMNDLFNLPTTKIETAKTELTTKCYETWISYYTPYISKLPAGFFHHKHKVQMLVNEEESERWYTKRNPHYYLATVDPKDEWRPLEIPFTVPREHEEEVSTLHQQDTDLQKEMQEMKQYLNDSLDTWNTTTKLRKGWPEMLHKYIPEEPKRAPRKAKQVKEEVVPDAPTSSMQQRVTLNILEN